MELGVTTKQGETMNYHIEKIPQKFRMKKSTPHEVVDIFYKTRSSLIYGLIVKEEEFENTSSSSTNLFSKKKSNKK